MGILRRSMWYVLLILVIVAAVMAHWPGRQVPEVWHSLWLISTLLVIACCFVGFQVVVRAMRLQVADKTRTLAENERFLATLMGNLPGMAYRRADDRVGSMKIVSEGGFALTGYRPEEMVRFRDLVHPDDVALVFPAIGEETAAGKSFRRKYRLRTKAGDEKWVLEQGVGVPGIDGKGMFVEGFLLDINDCVTAHEALQQSREKYRAIFDNATEGIFQLATDGTLLVVNRALAGIFGYSSPEEMIEAVNSGSNGLLGQKVQAELLSALQERQTVEGFELEYRRRNGASVSLSIKAHGLPDASGALRRIDGVIEDITGRKETERLRIERDAAEAASKTKSDFLANIGHEIRTPLNSILGFSQILQAQLGEERLQQYIHAITASGKTLLRLINDLLDLSKIEAGKFEIQPSAVDLQRVAREIQLMFMPSVDEKQLKFAVDLDPSLPRTVFLDEVRLRQILVNLLRNAFKFTDKGSITLSLRVIGRSRPGTVDLEIEVADTGIGVPPEDQETIFEAFIQQRRQDQAKYAGTGLGLSITRRLVEILGGRISLHSEVGKGSTFSAVLHGIPIAEDHFNRSLHDNEGRNILFDEEAVVLVIDAMDSDRLLIREFLRSTKLSIVETISIADGVEWCMAIKPDLILLDYTLSLVPDPLLVQRFNRVKDDLNIPIVVMTSVTGVGSDDFHTDYRFDGWLGKPLLFEDVMRMLARFLPHATLGREDDALGIDAREEYALPAETEVRQAVAGLNGRLPVLRRILLGNMLAQWQEIQETCIINEMKSFAEEIEQMSAEYNLDFLADWAGVLLNRIRLFDMERVPKTFYLFADLVDLIEKCSRMGSAAEEHPYLEN